MITPQILAGLNRIRSRRGAKSDQGGAASVGWSPVEAALFGLLSAKRALNVIQIGANDGKWSDPLHPFLMAEANTTNVLFIEPQPEIAAILAETYDKHPSMAIFVGAVALEPGETRLYRVRSDLWEQTSVPWMKYAPKYRAPSGFASTDRKHVEAHIKNLRWRASGEPVCMADAIEELRVPAMTLLDLAVAYPSVFPVDLLQVDVEGLDDKLVLSAMDCQIFPTS